MTVRDRIWDATLELLYQRPIPFQAWRVRDLADLDESSDRTIRRTLREMEDLGWLSRESSEAHYWKPGPKAEKMLRSENISKTDRDNQ